MRRLVQLLLEQTEKIAFTHKEVCGDLTDKVSGKFQVIAANIVADIIIGLCKNVKDFMNPDAIFITSGIIVPREEDVLAAFAENGLEVIARHESGGWLCFESKAAE